MMAEIPGDAWRGRDPAVLRERREREQQRKMAHTIAKGFDENKWAERVALLPRDWHEGVWEFLEVERQRRALCSRQ